MSFISRKHLRVTYIAFGAVGAGIFFGVLKSCHVSRTSQLAAEINAHGGECTIEPGVSRWAQYTLGNELRPEPTFVGLDGDYFDAKWLAVTDHLSALKIDRLRIYQSSLTGEDIEGVLVKHDVMQLEASGLTKADTAAEVLGQKGDASDIDLRQSDLTDRGLRDLPLETVRVLRLDDSRVTAHGLECLSRCVRLQELSVDGEQFNEAVASVLRSVKSLRALSLNGAQVDDTDVRLLHTLPHVSDIMMYGISASQEVVDEFARARPDCLMMVDGANCYFSR